MSPAHDLRFFKLHRGCEICAEPTLADVDAAQRISDEMDFHLTAGKAAAIDVTGRWIAVRLSDGKSDHHAYPSKAEAMRHACRPLKVAVPRHLLFLEIQLTGMQISEAFHMLRLFRQSWLRTDAPVENENPYRNHPLSLPNPRMN